MKLRDRTVLITDETSAVERDLERLNRPGRPTEGITRPEPRLFSLQQGIGETSLTATNIDALEADNPGTRRGKLFPFLAGGQFSVSPKERGNLAGSELRLGNRAVEQQVHDRRNHSLCRMLDGARPFSRQPISHQVYRDYDANANEPENPPKRTRVIAA